jgi:hypothetical protein
LPDLPRQSGYSRLAAYEDLNDAERISTDPTSGVIGSPKRLQDVRAQFAAEIVTASRVRGPEYYRGRAEPRR